MSTKSVLQEILKVQREPKSNKDQKETETIYTNSYFTGNTMPLNTYPSIITLNVSGLNVPIKRQRYQNGIKNKTHQYAAYKKLTLDPKIGSVEIENHYHVNGHQKESQSSYTYIRQRF